ncbi:hypothetical protein AB4Y42_39090 [Paraburkholderia sp. EG286B]|uniref:hypothetical protein n=1 Tax=Paraburkholderia sp. EG286B TaxID=3237011 RepID=UPI0034D1C6BF
MQNLFGFRLASRPAIGLLQLGVLADWGCGGPGWLLEHYIRWVVQRMRGLSLSAIVPAALDLGMGGTAAKRVTPQLPAVAVAVAEGVAHRLRRDRGAT